MKKILLSLSLLAFLGLQTGCESNRQMQEEVELDTESTEADNIPPTREVGGGGSNR